MKNKSYAFLILLLGSIIIFPLGLASQNKYVVKLIQPDPIGPPSINYLSTTSDSTNIIDWNKSLNTFFVSIGIYRESDLTSNKWELIDKVNSQTNAYVDQSCTPMKLAYRYRISGFDKCGSETALCNPHRTIRLNLAKTNSHSYLLSWNAYEGKPIQFYNIYRGITTNALQLIASSITTQYNDTTTLPKGDLFYRVEAELADDDPGSPKSVTSLNEAWSNISSILSFTGRNDTAYNSGLQIFPNPSTSQVFLFFPNPLGKPYEVFLYDLTGKPILSKAINTSQLEIDTKKLKDGIYLVKVKGEQFMEGKMVVRNNF